jgi:hypothetical protein
VRATAKLLHQGHGQSFKRIKWNCAVWKRVR